MSGKKLTTKNQEAEKVEESMDEDEEDVTEKEEKKVDNFPTLSNEKQRRKPLNISDEERQKRSERMKLLRAKLDSIGKAPQMPPKPPNKNKVSLKDITGVVSPHDVKGLKGRPFQETEEEKSEESEEEEPPKPVKKTKATKGQPMYNKPSVRKVFKIKYYHEPTQAELLSDRLFLETQHQADNNFMLNNRKTNNNTGKDPQDISDKIFNY